MRCAYYRGNLRVCVRAVIVAIILAATLPGCGGSRRAPTAAGATRDSHPGRASAGLRATSVRVLLLEDFDSCRVEGSDEGSALLIEEGPGEVRLVSVEGNVRRVLKRGSGFRLSPASGRFLSINGKAYRGEIEAFLNPVGRAVVVNELPIEEYLKGVVPLELGPAQFPYLEALSTQAVAARTFVVAHQGTWASRGFDLFGDTRSQVYGGVAAEDPVSNRAVDRTLGMVSVYQGNPIVSLYSSTCGGLTEAFDQVFRGGPIAYLRGGVRCSDEKSRYYSWKERIDISEIQGSLDQHAGVGRLRELLPVAYGKSERIVKMKFVGSKGTRILEGNDIRFALGLRSNLITRLDPVRTSDGYIRQIQIEGRGWGHGVGLCQMGAVDLAQKGSRHDEILRHYYPGTTLVKWY